MHILVLGAGSDIGMAVARTFAAKDKADITLASRDVKRLERRAADLAVRFGVRAEAVFFDAQACGTHADFYASLSAKPDCVVVAFGANASQELAQKDFATARQIIDVNFTGAVSILEIVVQDMEAAGKGTIIVLSSVAALRGRKSNYIYGASKAALSTYVEGLQHRLAGSGVSVLNVMPGFVDTRMTRGMNLPSLITAQPEQVALDIYRAHKAGRAMVYSRWYWRWIMLVVRLLPRWLFHKTNL
jgi:short-subunit dehydrogenase